MDYTDIISLVIDAGRIATDKFLLDRDGVKKKTESDFVTAIDIGISEFIKQRLKTITPDIGFMSEEEVGAVESSRWILDPIDGTTNLLYDYNMSSISLGLCVDGKILFGVVYNPFTKDLFTAQRGKGACYNNQPIGKIKDRDLKECLVEFGAGVSQKKNVEENFKIAKEVFVNCLDIRRVCSSALTICYIASGKLNGYFERSLKPWDYAAASLILEECGGINTTCDGQPIPYDTPSSYIAGSPKAVDFLLKTVQANSQKACEEF